ncbi:MAG: endonuclease/exonuclease/phosphatase family protein [Anaerolineae bacterium]|nr:endonuclease/exonuclease/phosphatase family protein [Anaerolineae bacterium]
MQADTVVPVRKPRWKPLLYNSVFVLIILYGLGITFFLVARGLTERYTIIAWFNSGVHLLLISTLFLLPICLLARRYLAALALLPALVTFVVSYGVMFDPVVTAALPDDTPQLTLLTYNLTSKKANPEQLAANILEADADFVAVQELSPKVADYLEATLSEIYPYYYTHTEEGFFAVGMGVFSRYPILSEEYWRIHRAHQRVALDFHGQQIIIYNTRPIYPFISAGGFSRHREEVQALLDRANQETDPAILMGDFNMSDQSDSYRLITQTYTDAYHQIGWGMGFTFPAAEPDLDVVPRPLRRLLTIPVVRLDYVFLNNGIQPVEAHVLSVSGKSDHLPLYVAVTPQDLEP